VREPNTSFKDSSGGFNPMGPWKKGSTPENLAMFEALVGTTQELGYELGNTDRSLLDRADMRQMRAIYRGYFDSKLWLKAKTPLGKVLAPRICPGCEVTDHSLVPSRAMIILPSNPEHRATSCGRIPASSGMSGSRERRRPR
jgi:hypothetical protein